MLLDGEHAAAARIATLAGDLLLALRADPGGLEGKALGAEGDRRANVLIGVELAAAYPDDAHFSEEGVHDPERVHAARTWIVDPLDGTREFGEPGRTDWAVHVALVAGEVPIAGAVALPALGRTYDTGTPPVLPAPYGGPPRVVVSRTRPPALAADVAARLGGTLVPLGSAGAKAMAIVRGDAEVYVHAGGQYEWDSAAPVAVAAAAGLHASRLDGSPLRYNQPDPLLPDLVICRPELAALVLDAIASVA